MAEQYNREAEEVVLGSVLMEAQSCLPVVQEQVSPRMFGFGAHRVILQGINEMFEKGEPIDPITVGNRLEEKNLLHEIGGRAYLSELIASVTTTTSVEYYAKIIRKKWFLRELAQVGLEISELATDTDRDLSELLDDAEHQVTELTRQASQSTGMTTADLIEERFAELEHIRTTGEQPGYSTGYSDLDKYNGFQNEELTILAARPSMGKTGLSVEMARSMAQDGNGVLYFSAEMTPKSLIDRFAAIEARVNLKNLRFGKVSDEEWNRVQRSKEQLSRMPLTIHRAAGMDIMTLRSIARRHALEQHLNFIVVDYLTLISPGKEFQRNDLGVGYVANSLMRLGQELQVPILCLAQLNRGLDHREDKRPRLSDLRESGEIEQAAHVVWFLYRESYYKDQDEEERQQPQPTEVLVAKNRNGPVGKATLTFHPIWAGFEAYAPF